MAKFVGGRAPFIGTRDNLTIYLMKGEYIARTKSSLTGKRVKRDPAFARTMENAGRLKKASRIASLIYRQMPADSRAYKQYRELVGKAMTLLKNGFDVEYVLIALEVVYLSNYLADDLSSDLSDDLSDRLPDCLFDRLSDHFSDRPARLVDYLPEKRREIAVLPAQHKLYTGKIGNKQRRTALCKGHAKGDFTTGGGA